MTKTPEEIAIEVFEKGEDGMTPILTRLEIAASLGIAEGQRMEREEIAHTCIEFRKQGIAEGRATLAKELLELYSSSTIKEFMAKIRSQALEVCDFSPDGLQEATKTK